MSYCCQVSPGTGEDSGTSPRLVDSNAITVPGAFTLGSRLSLLSPVAVNAGCDPSDRTDTRSVVPVTRFRMNTSRPANVSPGTRSFEIEANTMLLAVGVMSPKLESSRPPSSFESTETSSSVSSAVALLPLLSSSTRSSRALSN